MSEPENLDTLPENLDTLLENIYGIRLQKGRTMQECFKDDLQELDQAIRRMRKKHPYKLGKEIKELQADFPKYAQGGKGWPATLTLPEGSYLYHLSGPKKVAKGVTKWKAEIGKEKPDSKIWQFRHSFRNLFRPTEVVQEIGRAHV